MSNFIYGNNLNGDYNNREPIHFSFGQDTAKRSVNITTLISACVICVVVSVVLGILGGMLVSRFTAGEAVANEVIVNDISISPFDTMPTNGKLLNGESSRVEIIAGVKDTVVEVRTEYTSANTLATKKDAGSGVIAGKFTSQSKVTGNALDQGYYILTNTHVVEGAVNGSNAKITVTLTNGTTYNATVVGSDIISDIAVLKISETKELQCAVLANNNYELQVGEDIIAIGNPLGQLGGTVTNGFVSAKDRIIDVEGINMNLLQIDAPINPGNSGGGLFNLRGELVGIVSAKSVGKDVEGLGFAIPVNDALKVYKDIISLSYVSDRPTLFVDYETMYNGVYVTKVHTRNSGDNSDVLKLHDQILGAYIDGEYVPVESPSDLDNILCRFQIGDKIKLDVRRGNQRGTVNAVVYEFYI